MLLELVVESLKNGVDVAEQVRDGGVVKPSGHAEQLAEVVEAADDLLLNVLHAVCLLLDVLGGLRLARQLALLLANLLGLLASCLAAHRGLRARLLELRLDVGDLGLEVFQAHLGRLLELVHLVLQATPADMK